MLCIEILIPRNICWSMLIRPSNVFFIQCDYTQVLPLSYPIRCHGCCMPRIYPGRRKKHISVDISVTLARWRHKSLTSPVFTQPFVQLQIKENIIDPRHWPLCVVFTGEFPAQMASNAKNVSIWWRHHWPPPKKTQRPTKPFASSQTCVCMHHF